MRYFPEICTFPCSIPRSLDYLIIFSYMKLYKFWQVDLDRRVTNSIGVSSCSNHANDSYNCQSFYRVLRLHEPPRLSYCHFCNQFSNGRVASSNSLTRLLILSSALLPSTRLRSRSLSEARLKLSTFVSIFLITVISRFVVDSIAIIVIAVIVTLVVKVITFQSNSRGIPPSSTLIIFLKILVASFASSRLSLFVVPRFPFCSFYPENNY